MTNKIIKFHVHLPVRIEGLGQPIVIIGDYKDNPVKLHRPFSNNYPTYWQSEDVTISIETPSERTKIQYKYAIHAGTMIFCGDKIPIPSAVKTNSAFCRAFKKY